MKCLDDNTELLAQPAALQNAYSETGYLSLRNVLDRAAVTAVGEGVFSFLASRGCQHCRTKPRQVPITKRTQL